VSFWLEQPRAGPLPDGVTSDVESRSPYPLPWLDVQVLQFLLQDYLNLWDHATLVQTSFQAVILLRDWATNGLSSAGFGKANQVTRQMAGQISKYDDEDREHLMLLINRETTGGGTSVVPVNGTVHAMTSLGPFELVTRKLFSSDGAAKVIDNSPRRGERLPEIERFMGRTPAQSDASSNTSAGSTRYFLCTCHSRKHQRLAATSASGIRT